MTDNHHLMPRYRAQDRALTSVLLERDAPPEPIITSKVHVSKLPGDPRALRGIPVLAEGVGSAIPGTNPEAACIRKLAV